MKHRETRRASDQTSLRPPPPFERGIKVQTVIICNVVRIIMFLKSLLTDVGTHLEVAWVTCTRLSVEVLTEMSYIKENSRVKTLDRKLSYRV